MPRFFPAELATGYDARLVAHTHYITDPAFSMRTGTIAKNNSLEEITPFTKRELQAALSKMKNGKAADTQGIIAEMLETACEQLLRLMLELFNDSLLSRVPPDE